MSLRVASWNMHSGVGLDGRFSPQRIARVLAELDADVIALQEFGSGRAGFDMRAHLQEATGWPALSMPTCSNRHGEFGNAVLSRLPIAGAVCHPLGVAGREPRNAIEVVVECAGGPLRVIATHLGLQRRERHAQIARLAQVCANAPAGPLVLLGDFNSWRGRALRGFAASAATARAPRTFPAPFPLAALDRIFVSPGATCIDLRVHRSRAARVASDHLPLIADIELVSASSTLGAGAGPTAIVSSRAGSSRSTGSSRTSPITTAAACNDGRF